MIVVTAIHDITNVFIQYMYINVFSYVVIVPHPLNCKGFLAIVWADPAHRVERRVEIK